MLYAWTLLAAGMFALGERFCRNFFARQPAAGSPAKDPAQELMRSIGIARRSALPRRGAVFLKRCSTLCGQDLREATYSSSRL